MGTSTRQPVQIFPYAYRTYQQGSLCSYFHMHRAYTHTHTHSYTVLYIKVLVAFRINEKSASKFSLVILLLETGNQKSGTGSMDPSQSGKSPALFMTNWIVTRLGGLRTVPSNSTDHRQKLGRQEGGRGAQPTSNLESLNMPKMPTLAVKTFCEGEARQLELQGRNGRRTWRNGQGWRPPFTQGPLSVPLAIAGRLSLT